MTFPVLARFTDLALLLLRLMVGAVFVTSGWKHLRNPEVRSKDIGMSKGFTAFLGAAEFAGSLGVIFGVLAQLAAIGLIAVMLGAIQKKIFVWRTGFWGKWVELRPDAGGNESGDCDDGRWDDRPANFVAQVSRGHVLEPAPGFSHLSRRARRREF